MPHAAIPNPEAEWEARAGARAADRREVERRIGRVTGPLTMLSGGLANTNLLLDGRVLRIYRRDPDAARVEAKLLAHGWSSFRVPALLSTGDDFLLLEYVSHGPVLGSDEHGGAVGRALAEIHSVSFASAGFLGPDLTVVEPFPDVVTSLVDYARSKLTSRASGLSSALSTRMLAALETEAPAMREVAGRHVLLHADFKPSNLHWATDDRLLVLDWEFAYSGSALSDIGQLLRWRPPPEFERAFARSYVGAGGTLPADYERWASLFDLVNLAGLLANLADTTPSRRARDVSERVEETLALLA